MSDRAVIVFLLALALVRIGAALCRLSVCKYPRKVADVELIHDRTRLVAELVWFGFLAWVISR